MNNKKNDTVIVLSGKDKGVKGKVLVAMPKEEKVVVEKVNVATCHTKPRLQGGSVLPQVRQGRAGRLQGFGRQEDPYLPQVRRRDLREELRLWLAD